MLISQEILQNNGPVMHQLPNVVHVYLNMFGPMIVEKVLLISNSERMPCNQTTWMQAFTAPLYSASIEDNAMASYLLLD